MLVEFETGQIICTAQDKGRVHDFKLLKRSRLPFMPSQLCLADKGYQGLANSIEALVSPQRSPVTNPCQGRKSNTTVLWHDCGFEPLHVIRRFKIFRIFALTLSQSPKAFWLALEFNCWAAELRTGTCCLIHAGGLMNKDYYTF
ncbi:MAG: hypothetical protein ACRCZS_26160 [Chroococcidiopsis sp.]